MARTNTTPSGAEIWSRMTRLAATTTAGGAGDGAAANADAVLNAFSLTRDHLVDGPCC